MATVTFAGTTIWNDATTGRNRVVAVGLESHQRWDVVPLPRSGSVGKDLGKEGATFAIEVQYDFTGSEWNSHVSTLASLENRFGTLTFPPSRSVPGCIMLFAEPVKTPNTHRRASGTIIYRVHYRYTFKRLN
jgi:hypothetical protein